MFILFLLPSHAKIVSSNNDIDKYNDGEGSVIICDHGCKLINRSSVGEKKLCDVRSKIWQLERHFVQRGTLHLT